MTQREYIEGVCIRATRNTPTKVKACQGSNGDQVIFRAVNGDNLKEITIPTKTVNKVSRKELIKLLTQVIN